jgi:hypothetical protein
MKSFYAKSSERKIFLIIKYREIDKIVATFYREYSRQTNFTDFDLRLC